MAMASHGEAFLGAEDDPCGGLTPKGGREKDAMQGFIRHQMNFIMRPVGDHVRELQDAVQKLQEGLKKVNDRTELMKSSMDKERPEYNDLKDQAAANGRKLDDLAKEVAMNKRSQDRLEADHEVSKAALQQVEDRMDTMNQKQQGQGQDVGDLKDRILRAEFGLQRTNNNLDGQGTKVDELKELYEGLNRRHMDMVQDLRDLGRAGAATDRALRDFMAMFDAHKEDVKKDTAMKDKANAIERAMGDMSAKVQSSLQDLYEELAKVKSLQDGQDAANGRIKSLEGKTTRMDEQLQGQSTEVGLLKDGLYCVKKDLTDWRHHIDELVQRLQRLVDANTAEMKTLAEGQHHQAEGLVKLTDVQQQMQKDAERLTNQARDLQRHFAEMHQWRKQATSQLEEQGQALDSAENTLENLGKGYDALKAALNALKEELAQMQVTVGKLGSRYDTCNQKLQGISMGFQETSRNVELGSDGMLKPKLMQGGSTDRTLPKVHGAGAQGSQGDTGASFFSNATTATPANTTRDNFQPSPTASPTMGRASLTMGREPYPPPPGTHRHTMTPRGSSVLSTLGREVVS